MFLEEYKGKKVFITGNTGFKGSWLNYYLHILGADTLGYSLSMQTTPNLYSIINNENTNTIIGDIRDEQKLTKAILDYKPDIVFHLAAQPLVRDSYIKPKETYETNVIGTLNLYEAVRKCDSVKAIVTITTDKCYENKEWVYGYRENDPMGGFDPYSSSKGCCELLSSSYKRSFFEKKGKLLATARAGNVIGGGDFAKDRLIPDFVKAVSKNETVIIRSPKATRPWQHVLEPLTGYLMLGAKLLKGNKDMASAWNFGPYDVLDVQSVLDEAIKVWGKGDYEIAEDAELHEAHSLKLDISKAKAILKWEPKYDVYTAIKKTIKWYRNFYDGNTDMKLYTEKQIKDYIKMFNNEKVGSTYGK